MGQHNKVGGIHFRVALTHMITIQKCALNVLLTIYFKSLSEMLCMLIIFSLLLIFEDKVLLLIVISVIINGLSLL